DRGFQNGLFAARAAMVSEQFAQASSAQDEAMKCRKNIVGKHCVDTRHQFAGRYHLMFAGKWLLQGQFFDPNAECRCSIENGD
ncbi:hypothetical protein AB9F43_33055, partial [Rhizobium leguminosarum]